MRFVTIGDKIHKFYIELIKDFDNVFKMYQHTMVLTMENVREFLPHCRVVHVARMRIAAYILVKLTRCQLSHLQGIFRISCHSDPEMYNFFS